MKNFLAIIATACLIVQATAQGCPIGFECRDQDFSLVIDRPCGSSPGDFCIPASSNSRYYYETTTTTTAPSTTTTTSASPPPSPGCPPGYQCFDSYWNPVYDRVCGSVPSDTCFPAENVATTTTKAPPTTTSPPSFSGCFPGYLCFDINWVPVSHRVCGSMTGDRCVPEEQAPGTTTTASTTTSTTTPSTTTSTTTTPSTTTTTTPSTTTSATPGPSPGCPPGYQCFDAYWNPVYDRVCGTAPSDTCYPADNVATTTTKAPSTTTSPPSFSGCAPGYLCFDSKWVPVSHRVCGSMTGDQCIPQDPPYG